MNLVRYLGTRDYDSLGNLLLPDQDKFSKDIGHSPHENTVRDIKRATKLLLCLLSKIAEGLLSKIAEELI